MTQLRKTLGVRNGTALMLNIVLGAGLLSLPGLAYREIAGDALWLWVLCATVSLPLLLVFALIGRNFPSAGGIPAIAGDQFGSLAYTACTFLFFGAVSLGLPAIAITGGFYAASFINASPYFLALLLLLMAGLINFLSVKKAGKINSAIASLLVFVIIAIIVAGLLAVQGQQLQEGGGHINAFSFEYSIGQYSAVFMMVFFAFTGWEVAAHLSEEFKNPARDVPLAMGLSFIIALLFYVLLAYIVAQSQITDHFEAPFTALFAKNYGAFAGTIMSIVALILVFANLSAAVWAVSRMVVSAAREGLFPASLAQTKDGAPLRAVIAVLAVLSGAIILAQSGLLPLAALLEYAGQNFLILYGFAAAALLFAKQGKTTSLVAVIALLIVVGLLVMREFITLTYPLILMILALMTAQLKKRNIKRLKS
ncbi:APC family permease [Polycladidibacter stylochi]|uniref:APC family permease n=1 Tax=Polycladidibacter stylochi TaxID=1807766 RepID=UPI00082B57F9|nr:amino acid permease [Pseudovibrio stylochi]